MGVRVDHGLPPANQEIAVEFDNHAIEEAELSALIAQITLRLEQIGIEEVRVLQAASGKLKISYHSNLDIEFVRVAIQRDINTLVFNLNQENDSFPFSIPNDDFKIKVVLLQDGQTSENSFHGILVESISFKDYYLKPKFPISNAFAFSEIPLFILEKKTIIYENSEHPVRVVPYRIPEVRAGPLA